MSNMTATSVLYTHFTMGTDGIDGMFNVSQNANGDLIFNTAVSRGSAGVYVIPAAQIGNLPAALQTAATNVTTIQTAQASQLATG